MNKLRVVVADDERPARLFLKTILQNFEDVEIVGEAENGAEAVEIIKSPAMFSHPRKQYSEPERIMKRVHFSPC